jgi:branched-chain amino acid transport system ATP-binding protein
MNQTSGAPDCVLRVDGLSSGYDDVPVLWDVSLEVRPGEIIALVGANGAGKSTMLKAIAGLIATTNGGIRLCGNSIEARPYYERVAGGLSLIPEGRGMFQGLSVEENLRMGAYLQRDRRAVGSDLDRVYAFFPKLRDRRRQLAGTLSGGEQQMCAIGRGLMSRPRLLMIDELSLGLAPVIVDSLVDILREIRTDGLEMLLVEQDLNTALGLADRGYVLEVGRVVLEGRSKDLLDNPKVQRAYLGM